MTDAKRAEFINSMGKGLIKRWLDVIKLPRKELEKIYGEQFSRAIRKLKTTDAKTLTQTLELLSFHSCNYFIEALGIDWQDDTPTDEQIANEIKKVEKKVAKEKKDEKVLDTETK